MIIMKLRRLVVCVRISLRQLVPLNIIMRPSSLGGGRILRRTRSVRPSRYRCHR